MMTGHARFDILFFLLCTFWHDRAHAGGVCVFCTPRLVCLYSCILPAFGFVHAVLEFTGSIQTLQHRRALSYVLEQSKCLSQYLPALAQFVTADNNNWYS
jgi:hypothetical protein